VLLFDPQSWRLEAATWQRWHRPWALLCLVVTLAAGACYAISAVWARALPGGSSWPGLSAGVGAGLLFLYLFAFVLRHRAGFRLWFERRPTKYWLAQHIWLGLLTFPLVALHSGLLTRWGGTLSAVLLVVYLAVLGSGIWGLALQQRTPRRLLKEVPDETIRSQIPELCAQLHDEAELLVLATCGPPAEDGLAALRVLQKNRAALHAAQTGKGTGLLRVIPAEALPDTEPLRHYFHAVIGPFLRSETSPRSALRARMQADFRELRRKINPAAGAVLDALEDLCERRRQFDEQTRLHAWLHGWIAVHLSLSAVLLVLLVWHAVSAVWYW
jgi:hypothetical protein